MYENSQDNLVDRRSSARDAMTDDRTVRPFDLAHRRALTKEAKNLTATHVTVRSKNPERGKKSIPLLLPTARGLAALRLTPFLGRSK